MAEIEKVANTKRKRKNIKIPKRAPSLAIPERVPVYSTPDKTTCADCPCFPKDPYVKNKKLNPCSKSPLTLYELAANVVDTLIFPEPFTWSESQVAQWFEVECGYPEYKECILRNHIDGRRLLFLEDASVLPDLNVTNFEHIKRVTAKIRILFGTEMVKFARNMTLPPRKPLTHCTWFKSRTGPSWGIRQLWNRCDIFRWMKMIKPEPKILNHWDLVWYKEPTYPRVKFARVFISRTPQYIPNYEAKLEPTREYLVKRKFILQSGITESKHFIWMEHLPEEIEEIQHEQKKVPETSRAEKNNIMAGLNTKEFLLAKRKMKRPKFFL